MNLLYRRMFIYNHRVGVRVGLDQLALYFQELHRRNQLHQDPSKTKALQTIIEMKVRVKLKFLNQTARTENRPT